MSAITEADVLAHATKSCGEVEKYLHPFLTSALDGVEWSSSRPSRFTPRKVSGIHWPGFRPIRDALGKRTFAIEK
jgi:hypothetical protein